MLKCIKKWGGSWKISSNKKLPVRVHPLYQITGRGSTSGRDLLHNNKRICWIFKQQHLNVGIGGQELLTVHTDVLTVTLSGRGNGALWMCCDTMLITGKTFPSEKLPYFTENMRIFCCQYEDVWQSKLLPFCDDNSVGDSGGVSCKIKRTWECRSSEQLWGLLLMAVRHYIIGNRWNHMQLNWQLHWSFKSRYGSEKMDLEKTLFKTFLEIRFDIICINK